uniref:Odorant binding protein 2 n=1 Tax=Sclerodermus sp. MQW-2015 TaxID=1729718 RepID=A0A0N9K707_9HYME|nr:odorant binding protein 2 [Sclerodermus sp. MQW-2015]
MKSFSALVVLLIAILASALAADNDDPFESTRFKCQKEYGFSDEELLAGEENLEPMKCFLFCFLKDLQVADDTGNFDPAVATMMLDDDIRETAKSAIYKCHADYLTVSEPCQHSYDVVKCFKETLPEIYKMLGIFRPPQIMSQ